MRWFFIAGITLLAASASHAQQALTVERTLAFGGAAASLENVSGVVAAGGRLVLVDDELRGVLLGREESPGSYTFGEAIVLPAPGKEEFDLEALTTAGGHVFAIGSHSTVRTSADGASRKQARNLERLNEVSDRADRQHLFRFTVAPDGTIAGVQSASLQPLLAANPFIGRFVGQPGKENGVDIEGMAADGDVLRIGFRGPVLRHGFVPVLRVSGFPTPRAEGVDFVPLDGRGIRDLVKVSGGFLVLAGPVGDSDQSSRLYLWNGGTCIPGEDVKPGSCVIKPLGDVPAVRDGQKVGRAEGLAILADEAAKVSVLVVFDGVPGGRPSVFTVVK